MKSYFKNNKTIFSVAIAIVMFFTGISSVGAQGYATDYADYGGGYDYGGYDYGGYATDYADYGSYGGYDYGGYSDYGYADYGGYATDYADYGSYGGYDYGGYSDYGYADYGGYATDYADYGGGYDYGNYSDYASNGGYSDYAYDPCSYGGCSSGGGYSSGGSSYQQPYSSGCSGSSCGGGSSRAQPTQSRGGGGFSLGLNYQDNDTTTTITEDNDWTYTDNSDRSVNISEDNDVTNTTITNTNVSDSYNTQVVQRDDEARDLRVQCIVSDSSVELGDVVSYRVEVSGGNSPFDIEWRGSVDGNDQEERVRYTQLGTFSASVIVEDDDGRRASDNCTAVTVGNPANTGTLVSSGTTYVQPTGQLASLSAVSLSQVPYTGPADILKVLGSIALLALLSLGGAYYLRKRRGTKTVSNGIAAFKQANKEAVAIR